MENNKDTMLKIKQCVMHLMSNHPFFGRIASEMNWVEENDVDENGNYVLPTAATDYKNIYYNREFFDNLSKKEIVFVIAHEILHNIMEHHRREGERHHKLWNMAADYAINLILSDENIGDVPTSLVDGEKRNMVLLDEKYRDMTSEEIYKSLLEENADIIDTFDEHNFGEKGSKKGSSEERQINKARGDFKNLVRESRQFAKMSGKLGDSLESIIDEMLTPKIDWRQLLASNITSCFKGDTDWNKPSRRRIDSRTVLPSNTISNTVDICVGIDTSGSISDKMLVDFLTEVAGILEVYKEFKLKIWSFDTEVHEVQEYDFESIRNIKEPGEIKIMGRGGTHIGSNWNHLKEVGLVPKQLIIFTDACDDFDECDPDYCSTTWIVHSNSKPEIPFGEWTHYDDE